MTRLYDDTLAGLNKLAAFSPTAAYVRDRRRQQMLKLSFRGDIAWQELVEELGPIEARRWREAMNAEAGA